jgi:hypothetical protein
MANLIDRIYFNELSERDPKDVCRRALCRYDDVNKFYALSVWGDEYGIFPHEFKIDRISKNVQSLHDYFYLFIIHYLLKSEEIEICNEWISEKDIPGGATFFRGPHEIPTNLISVRFNGDINEFRRICEELHGIPLNMADAAYVFKITPRIPVAVLYWGGDDEFPSESKILYDKTITRHLAPDIIYALAVEICTRLGRPHD